MFDLNILCIKQKKAKIINNLNIYVEAVNKNDKQINKRYWEIWRFMDLTDGIWYDVLKEENENAGTSVCDIYDDIAQEVPYWIANREDIKSDLFPFYFKQEYIQSIKLLMSELLKESPVKTIYLLCRCQSHEREIISGSLSMEEFFTLMESKKIYANICYIITDNPIEFYNNEHR